MQRARAASSASGPAVSKVSTCRSAGPFGAARAVPCVRVDVIKNGYAGLLKSFGSKNGAPCRGSKNERVFISRRLPSPASPLGLQ